MERVECADGQGKGLEHPRQHVAGKLEEGNATEQVTHSLAMRWREVARMDSRLDLVLEKAAGDERLAPDRSGGFAVFCELLGKSD